MLTKLLLTESDLLFCWSELLENLRLKPRQMQKCYSLL